MLQQPGYLVTNNFEKNNIVSFYTELDEQKLKHLTFLLKISFESSLIQFSVLQAVIQRVHKFICFCKIDINSELIFFYFPQKRN